MHYSVSCGEAYEVGMNVNSYDAMTISARKGETITKVVLIYDWDSNKNTLSVSSGTFDGDATFSGINSQNVLHHERNRLRNGCARVSGV